MSGMFNDSIKIISHDSWILIVKPDSLFKPIISDFDTTLVDFCIELADSNDRIIYKKKYK